MKTKFVSTLVASLALVLSCVQSYEKRVFRIATSVKDTSDNECHLKVLDQCLTKAYYLTHHFNQTDLISNEKDFDNMCGAVMKVINCMDSYFDRCSYSGHKAVYQRGKDQFYLSWKQMCSDGPVRENYVKHSKCIQQTTRESYQYHSVCMNKLQVFFEKTKSSMSHNILDVVNMGCCAFNQWHSCIDRLIEDKCGAGAKDAIYDLIEKASAGTVYKLCPKDYFNADSKMCYDVLA